MGLFDDDNYYFDPERYMGGGGGLVARLFPQPQGDGGAPSQQPSPFDGTAPAAPVPFFGATMPTVPVSPAPASASTSASTSPAGAPASPAVPPTPDYGQTRNFPIGNYQMPQFGTAQPLNADAPPVSPRLGDRLSAGFQNWAHTPVGNPIAALANGITGFNNGGINNGPNATAAPPSAGSTSSTLSNGDRLYAGFQNWAHTPVGNPFAAIANGIAGFNSGQASPQGSGDGSDVMSQYQALRARYGERAARLATVDPQFFRTLLAQPSADDNADGAAPISPPSAPLARQPPLRPAAIPAAPGGRVNRPPNSSRKPPINIRRSTVYGQ